MGDEGLEIYQATSNQTNSFRILQIKSSLHPNDLREESTHLIGVTVLEAYINFVGAQVHERELEKFIGMSQVPT